MRQKVPDIHAPRVLRLKEYFSRVIMGRQIMVFILILVLFGFGAFLSMRLFVNQLDRQAGDSAWHMEEFVKENLELYHVLATLVGPRTDLSLLLEEYPYFEAVYLIDPQKRLISSAPADKRFFAGMDMGGRYLVDPGDRTRFSGFFVSQKTGRPCLEASTPLPAGGWLNIELNLERLESRLDHFRLGTLGQAYLCDLDGSYLAHPDYQKVRTHTFIPPEIRLEETGAGQFILRPDRMMLVIANHLDSLKAWLVLEIDIGNLLLPFILVLLAISLVMLVLTMFFVWRQKTRLYLDVLVPVDSLDRLSRDIARGNLARPADPLPPSGIREIVDLGDTFLAMAQNLSNQRNALDRTLANLEVRNNEMQSFVHAVSHDLRSPLVTIRGFLSFLSESFQRQDLQSFNQDMERIDQAARTMEAHLQDILSLSRIGHVEARPTLESLSECARAAADLLEPCWQEAGSRPIIQADLPRLWVHRHQMVELFQNLFENSWKYRRTGEVLEITLREALDGWLEVRDNGKGFDPGNKERLFRLFERFDSTVGGSGVGLAIVRRIVDSHNGEIVAFSEGVGKGALFRFRLPGFEPAAAGGTGPQ